jgi:hypothetical protein
MKHPTKAEYRAAAMNALLDRFDDSDIHVGERARVKRPSPSQGYPHGELGAWVRVEIWVRDDDAPILKSGIGCEISQDTGWCHTHNLVHLRERAEEMGIE